MSTRKLLALTAIAPLMWGTTYLVTTEFLPEGRPLLAATLRALPAGLVILAITRTLPRGDWWWRAAVLGVLNIGAFFAFLFVSAYRLPGGVSATLGAVHPLIVAVLAVVILHQAFQRRTLVAALTGLAGVAMLVLTPGAALDPIGVGAGLLGGLSTAFGVVLTKRWGRPVPLLVFTGWQLVAGGLALLVPTLLIEGLPASLSSVNIAAFLWLALPGTTLAYFFWFKGILALPPTQVTLLAFLVPLVAALLGWVVLGQGLSLLQWAGAATIIASVVIATWSKRPAATDTPAPELRRRALARLAP